MIYYGPGLDLGWEWALTLRQLARGQAISVPLTLSDPNRDKRPHGARIKLVNSSKVGTNSVTSMWVAPLGQTPDYLDPQSQEARYEVDVSGMELLFPSGRGSEGETSGSSR
jgi:hypothetical protein